MSEGLLLDLVGNLLHALHRGMAGDFVNVVQDDALHAIVLTDGLDGRSDLSGQPVVKDEIDVGSKIAVLQMCEQICQRGPERPQVASGDAVILELTNGSPRPTVVSGAKDEENVRTTQIVHAGQERTVAKIIPVVARMADGRTAVGIVDAEFPPLTADELMPPCLADAGDVGLIPRVLHLIPDGIG